jgi:hypothetical protein
MEMRHVLFEIGNELLNYLGEPHASTGQWTNVQVFVLEERRRNP